MIIKIAVIVSYVVLLAILAAFIRFDMHDFTIKAIGAFTGAFFAFIFIRIGEILTKISERQKRHYAALVKLEHIFNRYLNDISDNIAQIEYISKIKQRADNSPPSLNYNRLEAFLIDDTILLDLANIAFINEMASFNVSLRKINSDMESINRSYDEIRQAALHRLIIPDSYVQNFELYVKRLGTVRAFLELLNDKLKRNLATVRLLVLRKPLFNRLLGFVFSGYQQMPAEIEITTELKRLEDEILETRQKSRQDINKIKKTA